MCTVSITSMCTMMITLCHCNSSIGMAMASLPYFLFGALTHNDPLMIEAFATRTSASQYEYQVGCLLNNSITDDSLATIFLNVKFKFKFRKHPYFLKPNKQRVIKLHLVTDDGPSVSSLS